MENVVKLRNLLTCDKCGAFNELADGYIWDKKWHPENIGCDCSGATFSYLQTGELKSEPPNTESGD